MRDWSWRFHPLKGSGGRSWGSGKRGAVIPPPQGSPLRRGIFCAISWLAIHPQGGLPSKQEAFYIPWQKKQFIAQRWEPRQSFMILLNQRFFAPVKRIRKGLPGPRFEQWTNGRLQLPGQVGPLVMACVRSNMKTLNSACNVAEIYIKVWYVVER